jgi:hypothetical protein
VDKQVAGKQRASPFRHSPADAPANDHGWQPAFDSESLQADLRVKFPLRLREKAEPGSGCIVHALGE